MSKISENKRDVLLIAINFTVGVIIGIVLFYANIRTQEVNEALTLNKTFTLEAFFRTAYQNMLWLFSIFLFHSIAIEFVFQPIIIVRGIVNGFSACYMLKALGVLEAFLVSFSQCLSILPAMAFFTLYIRNKKKMNASKKIEPCVTRPRDALNIFIISLFCALLEGLIFKAVCFLL